MVIVKFKLQVISSKKTNTNAIYIHPTNFHPISNQPTIVFSSKHLLKINNFLCNLKASKEICFLSTITHKINPF